MKVNVLSRLGIVTSDFLTNEDEIKNLLAKAKISDYKISSDAGTGHFLVSNEEDVWITINGITFSMQRIDEANNKITELAEKIKELEDKNKDLQEEVNILRMSAWE